MCFNFNPKILYVFLYFCILVWLFVIFYFNLLCKEILAHMTGAEQHRSELSAVTVLLYLIQTMSTKTVRLKIQQLILSASSASHMAVTAFYPTIILMITTAITEIRQNGKLINKYTYDNLNLVKEEYDYVNKFYINYSYDGAGNL